jgi:hypothetical protein
VSYIGLNRGCGSRDWEPPITVVSARSAAVMRAPCWSRRPGQRPRRPVHCMLFYADPRPARPSDRCSGRGSQAHCALLAFVDEGPGLPVGAPSAGRQQDPAMQLQAGHPQQKGSRRGPAYVYNIKSLRDREMLIAAQAEQSYERVVSQWKPRRPKPARGRLRFIHVNACASIGTRPYQVRGVGTAGQVVMQLCSPWHCLKKRAKFRRR